VEEYLKFSILSDCTHICACVARGGERTFHHLPGSTILIFYRTFKDSYAKSIRVTCMVRVIRTIRAICIIPMISKRWKGARIQPSLSKCFMYVRMHNVTRTLMIQGRFQSTAYDMYIYRSYPYLSHTYIYFFIFV